MLSEADQASYAEIFAPYIHQSAGQYTYRIKGKAAVWEHIQQLGVVCRLGVSWRDHRDQPIYQVAWQLLMKTSTEKPRRQTNRESTRLLAVAG
jgi:hypothetical protein